MHAAMIAMASSGFCACETIYPFLDVTRLRLSRAHPVVIFTLPELRYLTSSTAFRVSSRKLRATARLRTVKVTVTGQAYLKLEFNFFLTY